jgi:hypothetical protein
MNKYLKQIQELESDVFKNMGKHSQIVIDIVQDTEQDLNRDESKEPIRRDELGAINYQISILLEVYDPARPHDIEILKRLYKIIEDWYDDIEFINSALGIPLHDG